MTKDIEWLRQLVSAMDAVMDRNLTGCQLQMLWRLLRWSFGQGRRMTGRLTERELAARNGLTPCQAHKVLNALEDMRIIQQNSEDGGWQFMPEIKGFHQWLVRYRVKEHELFVAARMDVAQQVPEGQMDFWPEDTFNGQGTGNGSNATPQKCCTQQPGKSVQNDAGVHASPAASATYGIASQPGSPSKSFPSPVPSNALKDTLNTLRESPAISEVASSSSQTVGEPATGMDGEDYLDPYAADEKTLLERLERELGKEGPSGMKKKGGLWRAFIRGSLKVANDRSTAEAVRAALNLLKERRRDGKPIRNAGGFLYRHAQFFAAARGWAYIDGPDGKGKWKKVEPFNFFQHKNAKGKSAS